MNIDYIYNFKNPIRFFINISDTCLPKPRNTYVLTDIAWAAPFSFRIRKEKNSYRIIKMPNILNFQIALENFSSYDHFEHIEQIDNSHKRMTANLTTGDFRFGVYENQLSKDLSLLSIFDTLLRIDIKNFYGSLYTHKIHFKNDDERYFTNMNVGATNGLIMGNYISLYFAECVLGDISERIEISLEQKHIEAEYSYFSDDFFFFCNQDDEEQIIHLFDTVLESFELERNEAKCERWTYESYNSDHVIDRYFNMIVQESRAREKDPHMGLYFINQLIYRSSKLHDEKIKRTFINNFFKSEYFQNLVMSKYEMYEGLYHQLCWLYRLAPEAIIYSLEKFLGMPSFKVEYVKEFFRIRYIETLKTPYHDEQLYFYYGLSLLQADKLLSSVEQYVISSKNQVLISYYLKYRLFSKSVVDMLKQSHEDDLWFQNYHLILWDADLYTNLENSIKIYLIPSYAKKDAQKISYMEFYKANLTGKKELIVTKEALTNKVKTYFVDRYHEARHKSTTT